MGIFTRTPKTHENFEFVINVKNGSAIERVAFPKPVFEALYKKGGFSSEFKHAACKAINNQNFRPAFAVHTVEHDGAAPGSNFEIPNQFLMSDATHSLTFSVGGKQTTMTADAYSQLCKNGVFSGKFNTWAVATTQEELVEESNLSRRGLPVGKVQLTDTTASYTQATRYGVGVTAAVSTPSFKKMNATLYMR